MVGETVQQLTIRGYDVFKRTTRYIRLSCVYTCFYVYFQPTELCAVPVDLRIEYYDGRVEELRVYRSAQVPESNY